MAVEIDVADDHADLHARLVSFLTTNADLVAAGQEYELLETQGNTAFLRGVGLAGTDNIYTQLGYGENVGSDYYYLQINGSRLYNPGVAVSAQPFVSTNRYMHAFNSSIPYWFVANGRRYMVIAKISSTYHALYAGFYNALFTPTELPYPMAIAGNTNTPSRRWSTNFGDDGNFWQPGVGCMHVLNIDNSWINITNHNGAANSYSPTSVNATWPWRNTGGKVNFNDVRSNLDGSYTPYPALITSSNNGGNCFGYLDGVFWVSGFNNSSENTFCLADKPDYAGTGNGRIKDIAADETGVTETWTITCTATSADAGTFSVTGSVSGAQADATVGVAYDNGLIAFEITDGPIDYDVGDEFTVPVAQYMVVQDIFRNQRNDYAAIRLE